MFKSDRNKGDLNGFLDAGSHMQGELSFEDTFRVDGKLTGKVVSKGNLIVGERGLVEGTVEVARVYVSGTLEGTVRARKRIEVAPGGRLLADIQTPTLVIEDGAFFQGRCSMEKGAQQAPAETAPRVVTPLAARHEG